MNRLRNAEFVGLLLASLTSVASGQLGSQDSIALAEQHAEAVERAVERVQSALVQVRAIGEFRGVSRDASAVTTGVLLDRQWVVTSGFGLEQKPKVLLIVLPDGQSTSAAIESVDSGRNLALLKLAEEIDYDPPMLEPRSDPTVGETAIAVGSAYSAQSPYVAVGVVSATKRFLGRAVQADAATSPANYGGLMIDLHGRVLGIVTPLGQEAGSLGTVLYDSGIGFAGPLDDINDRLPAMKLGKNLEPGKAGMGFVGSNAYADPPVVGKLAPEGPAAVAGLKRGDRITQVAGSPVATQKQVQVALGPYDAGDEVEVQYQREEQVLNATLKLVAGSELKNPERALPSLLERLKLDVPGLE